MAISDQSAVIGNSLTDDLAWAAGLFEGEGSLEIRRLKRPAGYVYTLACSVQMGDEEPILFLQGHWPGSVGERPPTANCRRMYRWSVVSAVAATFLDDVVPYMRTSRSRLKSELALSFQAQKRRGGRFDAAYNNTQTRFFDAMKKLNLRGVSALTNDERRELVITNRGNVHYTAKIGHAPEHRAWSASMPLLDPEIDPTAKINALVSVDAGMSEPTRIGARSFLMKHVHVGHDAQIGADCELAPGTVIGGHAILEDGVRCGIGVLVKPGVRVGAGARLGAGAVVVKDVPAGEVWVGNPAAKLKRHCPKCGELLGDGGCINPRCGLHQHRPWPERPEFEQSR